MIRKIEQIEDLYKHRQDKIQQTYYQILQEAECDRNKMMENARSVYEWQLKRFFDGKPVITKGMQWSAKSDRHAQDFMNYVNSKRSWGVRNWDKFTTGTISSECDGSFVIEFADGTVTIIEAKIFDEYFDLHD